MNETFNGKNKKDYSFLWGDWLILCANPSMQIGQFFVRGMHQWIPAAAMSSQPTVCLLVVVRMASNGFLEVPVAIYNSFWKSQDMIEYTMQALL